MFTYQDYWVVEAAGKWSYPLSACIGGQPMHSNIAAAAGKCYMLLECLFGGLQLKYDWAIIFHFSARALKAV